MSKVPLKKWLLWGAGIFLALFVTSLILVLAYVGVVVHEIDARLDQLHNLKASHFYAWFRPWERGKPHDPREAISFLADSGYVQKRTPEDLIPGEYAVIPGEPYTIYMYRKEFRGPGHPLEQMQVRLIFSQEDGRWFLQDIRRVDGEEGLEFFERVPKQVATFLAGRLRTQDTVLLSDIPVSVRHAVMAIEDAQFLEHYGVSFKGIFRAFLKNIRQMRVAQGGSTITQQLMKNLFFSNKREFSRKLKEVLFAFITEIRHSKETILEAYLNEVYLGQAGPHEIHGVAEAARSYFNRSVSELSLGQSALLAAIIQAPNSYDPRKHGDRALKRRNLVLKKMLDADFILEPEYELAAAEPLGVVSLERSLGEVDYFTNLLMERLPADIRKRLDSEPLTVYVTLNPRYQVAATQTLAQQIARLEKSQPKLTALAKKNIHLQGALMAIDVPTCSILAVQGGKSYQETQFNRITQGKRQAGSLFKPFVFLTALETTDNEGAITPQTLIDDSPFEWKYDKQLWKPKNYDNTFRGNVTLRQALEESLNVPTARITQRIGVPSIVANLVKAGITSPLPEFPSISLGSADVTPLEVAESFTTIANLGRHCTLKAFHEVFDANGNLVTENKPTFEEVLNPRATFQTVNILKGVLSHGTAKAARALGLTFQILAGKTGTTNDARDAWFVGFSPEVLVLVWVGYDVQEKVGLTGAGAALPVWMDFMKAIEPTLSYADFVAPEGLTACNVPRVRSGVTTEEMQPEYFIRGTEPPGCT